MSANGNPRYQLDASAVLAVMLNEPGHDRVRAVIDNAAIHAANLAEVIAKLIREGVPADEAHQFMEDVHLDLSEEFSLRQASDCGALIAETRRQGLSLGDCICLTAAGWKRRIALTAERQWKELEGREVAGGALQVELIR